MRRFSRGLENSNVDWSPSLLPYRCGPTQPTSPTLERPLCGQFTHTLVTCQSTCEESRRLFLLITLHICHQYVTCHKCEMITNSSQLPDTIQDTYQRIFGKPASAPVLTHLKR